MSLIVRAIRLIAYYSFKNIKRIILAYAAQLR